MIYRKVEKKKNKGKMKGRKRKKNRIRGKDTKNSKEERKNRREEEWKNREEECTAVCIVRNARYILQHISTVFLQATPRKSKFMKYMWTFQLCLTHIDLSGSSGNFVSLEMRT